MIKKMNNRILYTLLMVSYKVFAKVLEEGEDYEEIIIYNIDDARNLFNKFIKDFKKSYKDDAEYNNRLQIFIENLEYLNRVTLEAGQNSIMMNECADVENFDTASPNLGE